MGAKKDRPKPQKSGRTKDIEKSIYSFAIHDLIQLLKDTHVEYGCLQNEENKILDIHVLKKSRNKLYNFMKNSNSDVLKKICSMNRKSLQRKERIIGHESMTLHDEEKRAYLILNEKIIETSSIFVTSKDQLREIYAAINEAL